MRGNFKLLRQATVSFSSPRGLVLIDDFHSPVAAHCVVSCDACWLCLDRWLRRNFSRNAEALAYGGLRRFRSRCPGITNQRAIGAQSREANCQCHRLARHASLGRRAAILHDWRPGPLPPANCLATQHLLHRLKATLAVPEHDGDLLSAIVDTFLLSNPAGRAKSGVHVTDATTASRTALLQP